MYSAQNIYIYFFNMIKYTEESLNRFQYKILKSIDNKYLNIKNFQIQEL